MSSSLSDINRLVRQREQYLARVRKLDDRIRSLSRSKKAPSSKASRQVDQVLIDAAESGDLAGVRRALSDGANPNARSTDREPVLLLAVAKPANLRVVRELLNNGAEVDARDGAENTPLIVCVNDDNVAIVRELVAHGADVNAANQDGDTPLTNAACWGSRKVVKFLIDQGADRRITDGMNLSAAELARQQGHPDIAKLLS